MAKQPKGLSQNADLSTQEAAEHLLLAKNSRLHWHRADVGPRGYDPWDEDRPHHKQQAFHDAEARFKAFVGSVASGKSVAGAAESVKHLIEDDGATWIIAAPTYRMLTSSTMPAFFAVLQDEVVARSNKTEMIWELTNGSTVYFRSTDRPDTIRGIDAAGFWLDEGAYSSRKAWKVLIGRLRQVGYTHRGLVTTTPQGKNWVHEVFVDAESRHDDATWVRATIYDNPWLSEDYIASLEGDYSGRFAKQELEGAFVGLEGLVYPEFSFDTHVRDLSWDGEMVVVEDGDHRFEPTRWLVWCDWGYTNPMALAILAVDGDGRMWVLDEFYASRRNVRDVGRDLLLEDWFREYGKGEVVADPSEPEHIDEWNRMGITTHAAVNDLMPGINEMAGRLEVQGDGWPRVIVDEDCENIVKEFGLYRYPESDDDKPVKEKPVDKDNHHMDGARYVAMELKGGTTFHSIESKELDMVMGNHRRQNRHRTRV